MQIAPLGNPPPFLYQILMHDGDLPRRATEADEAELQPVTEGLCERDRVRAILQRGVVFHALFPDKAK